MQSDYGVPLSRVCQNSPSTDSTWKRARPNESETLSREGTTIPRHEGSPISVPGSSDGTVVSHAETFFEPLHLKDTLSNRFLQGLVLFSKSLNLDLGRISFGINRQPVLARLQEGFGPLIVQGR